VPQLLSSRYDDIRDDLLSGFFVEQAFAQVNGTNGGIVGGGTKGGLGGNGGNGTSGKTINGKNGIDANGHNFGIATTGSGDLGTTI
jgi:hypothetical protein